MSRIPRRNLSNLTVLLREKRLNSLTTNMHKQSPDQQEPKLSEEALEKLLSKDIRKNEIEQNKECEKLSNELVIGDDKPSLRLWQYFKEKNRQYRINKPRRIFDDKSDCEVLIEDIIVHVEKRMQTKLVNVTEMEKQLSEKYAEAHRIHEQIEQTNSIIRVKESQITALFATFSEEEAKLKQAITNNEFSFLKIPLLNIRPEAVKDKKAIQELATNFQLQRRQEYIHQKGRLIEQLHHEKEIRDKLEEELHEIKGYIAHLETFKEECCSEIDILKREKLGFLKNLLKYHHDHSSGINWLLKELRKNGEALNVGDLPDTLSELEKTLLLKEISKAKMPKQQLTRTRRIRAENIKTAFYSVDLEDPECRSTNSIGAEITAQAAKTIEESQATPMKSIYLSTHTFMRDLIQNKSWKHMKLNRSTNHALPAQGYDQIINSSIFNKYYGKIGQKAKKIKMQKLLFGNRMKIMTDSLESK